MSNSTCPLQTSKPLVWLKGEIKTPPFSAAARIQAGVLLRRLQRGEKLASLTRVDERRGMKAARKRRLAVAGWRVGSASQFLGPTEAEAALVELKLVLADALRRSRTARGLSPTELADRLRSSQSRVAKIEAGDPSISLDLIIRALIAAGVTIRDIGRELARR